MQTESAVLLKQPLQTYHEVSKPYIAFRLAMELMQYSDRTANMKDIQDSLKLAGFSQNGCKRIIHLCSEEVGVIIRGIPKDEGLLRSYMSELQMLLSKMDQARSVDSCQGRPYVTEQLSSTIRKLACLRYLNDGGSCSVQASKMRDLLKHDGWCKTIVRLVSMGQSVNQQNSESIQIRSAIQLLELYRDELIMPPRIKSRANFDEFDLHDIETGDFSWMDDGGESYLEAIRDIPLVTQYDELPHFEYVLDWFIATKPVFDSNQIKQGWNYLEKLSEEWHQNHQDDGLYGLSEEDIYQYPSWSCAVLDRSDAWMSTLPPDGMYKLVPLTTPHQLLEETRLMHHCVVTYLDDCIGGNVRIFSVRDSHTDQRIATAELFNRSGLWEVKQLKGKHNEELIHRTNVSDDPLGMILEKLTNWYNKNSISNQA